MSENATLLHDLRVIFRRFEDNGEMASAVVIRDAIRALSAAPRSASPEVLLSQGWLDIGHERKRQVDEENWSAEHDDGHRIGEMARAGAAYATSAACSLDAAARVSVGMLALRLWPWGISWWKPKGGRRDLVRAGTLIVAEIDRLDRQSPGGLDAVNGRLA